MTKPQHGNTDGLQRGNAGGRRRKFAGPIVRYQDRLALSVEELAAVSSLSEWSIYGAARRGDLRLRKVGVRTIIMVADAMRWLRGEPPADDNEGGVTAVAAGDGSDSSQA